MVFVNFLQMYRLTLFVMEPRKNLCCRGSIAKSERVPWLKLVNLAKLAMKNAGLAANDLSLDSL